MINKFVFWCVILITTCCAFNFQNEYCADMNAQTSIDIEQLLGMWYAKEIILHRPEDEGITEYFSSCPVIHLKQTDIPSTPYPPYGYGYGGDFGYGEDEYGVNYRTQDGRQHANRKYDQYDRRQYGTQGTRQYEYGRRYTTTTSRTSTTSRSTALYDQYLNYGRGEGLGNIDYRDPHNRDPYGYRRRDRLRKLELVWREQGMHLTYSLEYNSSRAGFWYSSGPQFGTMLEKQYDHFEGTIQVMKAVGNHLVLTFCYQKPKKELYSMLFSRTEYLSDQEVSDVHNLLRRRHLHIGNVRKVCNSGPNIKNNISLSILVAVLLCFRKFL